MALKDWKKIRKDFWLNKDKKSAIKFDRVRVPISAFGTKDRLEYRVSRGYVSGNFIEDYASYFKTKSQALKYAKAYIRKH